MPLVLCRDFAPRLDLNVFYRLSDVVNCVELLCDGYDMLSLCAKPDLFDWGLLPPALFVMMTLGAAGVRFDVSGVALLRGGDLVQAVSRSMISDVTGDGNWVSMATTERPRPGDSNCVHWLCFVTRGAVPVAPPINRRERTVAPYQ